MLFETRSSIIHLVHLYTDMTVAVDFQYLFWIVYIEGVCKIYSEQRAVRVKRVVDKKRM